ncbi:2-dehydropantoate 2-reductase [Mangrovibacillus cuniculi]|uniref:2-dehydropantoate 2-reductase n=1 Tax=Mangrovibacillus cuniculi TaxID=2593652 RepID=A0A7S8CA63_9BACI|nr:2-dehydropantoate 2-reductase [Mangrovibacillus cuniculi]QPC46246.1 2-dehydropantoate 2-reductase [Mangrovibacillus cuniculi]
MNITIIGGGSLGLLFGYFLSFSNKVEFVVRSTKQYESLTHNGLLAERRETVKKAKHIHTNLLLPRSYKTDLVIVAVKSYHISSVLPLIQQYGPQTPLLFIQNGMSHLTDIKQLPHGKVALATVEHGAARKNDYTVRINGIGKTNLANYRGEMKDLLFSVFSPLENEFPWEWNEDYEVMMAKKLIVNAVINPLTGVLKCKNGVLLNNPHYTSLTEGLFNEVMTAFPMLNKQEEWRNLIGILQSTKDNTSSMLSDLIHNRKTEIDGILLPIKSKERPLTEALYHAIKGLEKESV